MQDHRALEREALGRVPGLLADLLDEPADRLRLDAPSHGAANDVLTDDQGRRWEGVERTGIVARAAEMLAHYGGDDAIRVLVVPYMTEAGARAAADRGTNWLDLSGNARIRDEQLVLSREGRPNAFRSPGRPSSAFAPRSSRVARVLLVDPVRWWRQKDLVAETSRAPGSVRRATQRGRAAQHRRRAPTRVGARHAVDLTLRFGFHPRDCPRPPGDRIRGAPATTRTRSPVRWTSWALRSSDANRPADPLG